MSNPAETPKGPELKDLVWNQLPEDETGHRWFSDANLAELYQHGVVDARRYSLGQWQAAFKGLPKAEEGYRVTREQYPKLAALFFQGTIKRPFDPDRLKDGSRPIAWLTEIFQKVLRFETTLTLVNWNKIVQDHIRPQFVKAETVRVQPGLRGLLQKILKDRPSPLRKLELWYHQQDWEKPADEAPKKEKPQPPVVIKDSFQVKPAEIQKKSAIDKLYYHHEQHPETDDKESLSFLDELANLEDEGEL